MSEMDQMQLQKFMDCKEKFTEIFNDMQRAYWEAQQNVLGNLKAG